ncbi:MAG: valine--tRNA ligase [Bacillota bacterium]|nr:valine--tRNA ligase [Bacillota bacterium]
MSEKMLPPVYDPSEVEMKRYQFWLDGEYFKAVRDTTKEPFTIVIPPPNVTGSLHMGHALNNTVQDILIRWRRMQGYDALWIPGCDHAGIATQNVVEKHLAEEGIESRELGRGAFIERVWQWKDTYHERITRQLYRLGVSCDWSRERFTMDEGCSRAVRKVFVDLYHAGLIYRGDYMINWCPRCHTALSDIEVEHEDECSSLTHIRYPLSDGSGFITVATTRPETMLGDTGVAVHPDDHRYIKLVGKTVILPLLNREIPIVADEYVDPEFGSGAVKVTPGHDPNDFEIGQRHDLEVIKIIDEEAKMTEAAGIYAGLDRYESRKKVVEDLEKQGLIEKIEEHQHSVGHCQRCNTVVEPLISRQWFVKMKPLAQPALEAVKDGRTQFVPPRFTRIYQNWVENIRDWCISRQIWWGHRIPAWYCSCGEIIVSYEDPVKCPQCGNGTLEQDPDVLDTWFSSALWPFSTMGWPEQTPDLEHFYPTSVLVTAYDIIYFWVARMMFMGLEFMKEIPFHTVYITGLVRDALGRKMSKSLGNGIDPLDVIENYGADTLRFTLVTGQAPGNDQRFRQESVEAGRNFANKIWNASRFVLMNLYDEGEEELMFKCFNPLQLPVDLNRTDRWILHRYNETVQKVTGLLEKYELGEAARLIYEYLWNDFCDWYVEISKHFLYRKGKDKSIREDKARIRSLLVYLLDGVMRLLHPFMPHISEEIWQQLPERAEKALVVGAWPKPEPKICFSKESSEVILLQELIRAIRNLRSQVQIPPGIKTAVLVRAGGNAAACFREESHHINRLAFAEPLEIDPAAAKPAQALTSIIGDGIEVYLPLKGVIDLDAEVSRLEKEVVQLQKEILKTEGKLNSKGFIDKAPTEVIEKEKARRKEQEIRIVKLQQRLQELN